MQSLKNAEEYAFNQGWVPFENILYDKLYYFYDTFNKIIYCFDEALETKWFILKDPIKLMKLKEYNL